MGGNRMHACGRGDIGGGGHKHVGGEMVMMVASEHAGGEMLVGGDGGGHKPACMRGDIGGGRWSWWS